MCNLCSKSLSCASDWKPELWRPAFVLCCVSPRPGAWCSKARTRCESSGSWKSCKTPKDDALPTGNAPSGRSPSCGARAARSSPSDVSMLVGDAPAKPKTNQRINHLQLSDIIFGVTRAAGVRDRNMHKPPQPELRLRCHAYAAPAIGGSSDEVRLVRHLYDLQNTQKRRVTNWTPALRPQHELRPSTTREKRPRLPSGVPRTRCDSSGSSITCKTANNDAVPTGNTPQLELRHPATPMVCPPLGFRPTICESFGISVTCNTAKHGHSATENIS